ncbi:MAG TPA: DUF3310 domain-containing protein, partial [Candidatus Limosilactobacillus excrementigallinarum]|nr:DUF3310 domain-containing protein [Candidatus Limosilactobacillus excrementigallinarum]
MQDLRPNYYKNRKGLDIFWGMETGHYPYEQSVGFCRLSIEKYERRLGRKTKETTTDELKIQTYKSEIEEFKQRDDIAIDWDKAII